MNAGGPVVETVKHPEAMVSYLREQAARFRRLARATADAETKDMLYGMSHDCEEDAERVEIEIAAPPLDGEPRRPPR
jgi:hypothetical protein